jgi:2-oxoglutarate ferredoxin oxidoreductase subunit beta
LQYSHGFNTLHGRMPSVATGALVANHRLKVIGISGDGDTANIGLGQFKHACRRNVPMVYIVEDNGCYGLTKGQFSATADQGARLRREGGEVNPSAPFDLCLEAIASGASFVARSFAGDRKQLVPLLQAAIAHNGTAFIDVISPCVTFNDFPTSHKGWDWAKEHERPMQEVGFVRRLDEITAEQIPGERTSVTLHDGSAITLRPLADDHHDVSDRAAAIAALLEGEASGDFVTGLFYLNPQAPTLLDGQNLVDTPLSRLDDAALRPGPEVLEALMDELA